MSSNKCARCDQTVYPVEGLRCLDKIWHKGCFKCHECNMTLNLKNYKGFEKRPYCNAHCPQAKATTVADTPEIRRLAENTRIQSQAKYHEDFEKSKGKGFTAIVDDPEMRRIKETSKIISNAAYHGDLEKKKQMEERRGISGQTDDMSMIRTNSNNNNSKHQQNRMHILNNHHHNQSQPIDSTDYSPNHHDKYSMNQNQQLQQRQVQQQLQQQQQLILKQQQQQQLLLKQQQQEYIQNHNSQTNFVNRNSGQFDHQQSRHQQQQQQHYPLNPQQQQQLLMRQQQQQQHHMIMQQQQRQSLDPSMQPMVRQPSKQAIMNNSGHPQHIIKHQPINNIQAQAHQQQPMIKYVPMNDAMNGQAQVLPPHLIGVVAPNTGHMLDPPVGGGGGSLQNNQRVSGPALIGVSPQTPSHHQQQQQMAYNSHQMNGGNIVPAKHQQHHNQQHQMHMVGVQQQHHHHHQIGGHNPNQAHQMRSNPSQQHLMQAPPNQQAPRRVFRAMYDYAANDVDEVSFYENDILIDCVNVDRNWLIGRVARTGQTGMLPANYVNELPSQ